MATLFPISPSAGKNAKVYMNTSDGTLLSMTANENICIEEILTVH